MIEVEIDGYPVRKYWAKGSMGRHGDGVSRYAPLTALLVEKYKVCYFCGIQVKDYPHADYERLPPDAATIDHLMPRQYRKRFEVSPKVLACTKCNTVRNNQEQRRKK